MKRLLTPVFVAAVLAALLTACSNPGRTIATGLEIELTAIEHVSDGSVSVAWHVKNSNVVSYLFSRVSHKITLNGSTIGSIEETEPLAIPASHNAGRTSKLTKVDSSAARVLAEAVAAGSANYRVDSQVTILIYDDTVEKSNLSNSGTVSVKTK